VLLLDTCTFVWLAAEPEQLSDRARALLDDVSKSLALSDVSVWEICLKWQTGKIRLPSPPRSWIEEQANTWALERLEVNRSHFYRATELPALHRDPFDRLLVAQSLETGRTLISPDRHIHGYPVAVQW
jgi:PIN domain nuclease of toxin-antitoxin system